MDGSCGPHVLREYAVVADGERGALIGPRGDLVWMCFPRWHDGSVFSDLIGGRGVYSVTPRGRFVWGGYYEAGTLIWRSRWVTETGIVECREALALPTEPGLAVVLRRVIAQEGPARLAVMLDLRGSYGKEAVRALRRREDGAWCGEVDCLSFCWSGAEEASVDREGRLTLRLDLEAGEQHDLVLALKAHGVADVPSADAAWQATAAGWRQRVPRISATVAERDSRHAYAVLSGLTSESGGMVAAATTSLPERADEGRNYDYRYVWIRDQCYAGQAAARDEPLPLLDDAVRFVGDRLLEDGSRLAPAYTTTGEAVPGETRLGLPGYPGGGDTVGNQAHRQFQLDAFGEALLLFAAAARHDRLDGQSWRAAEIAAGAIAERRSEPDAGIWELEARRWTHSRLICAAGLRSIASCGPNGEQASSWLALADALTAEGAASAVHPSGRWQRAPDDERVDAALLLLPVRGAVAADDPRTIATLRAVTDELTSDGYVYRFRHGERPLELAEGAFLLCGFMMALAYAQQGQQVSAARFFERNRSGCGPPGLLAEEFDVTQRQLRGNLPQAFAHALLLESAIAQYQAGYTC